MSGSGGGGGGGGDAGGGDALSAGSGVIPLQADDGGGSGGDSGGQNPQPSDGGGAPGVDQSPVNQPSDGQQPAPDGMPVDNTAVAHPDDNSIVDQTLPDQDAPVEPGPEQEKPFVMPIYIYTAIFGVIFIIGPLLARSGPNVGITRCCIMISAFCCWIFWTTTYIVQMNPLLGPRMGNETLAWIGYKWGKDPFYIPDIKETEEVEEEGVLRAGSRQVIQGVPDPPAEDKALVDALAQKAAANEQQDLKVEPKMLAEEPHKDEPPKEEPPKEEPPTEEEPPKNEEALRRRFNGTNLFTNLTYLIRD